MSLLKRTKLKIQILPQINTLPPDIRETIETTLGTLESRKLRDLEERLSIAFFDVRLNSFFSPYLEFDNEELVVYIEENNKITNSTYKIGKVIEVDAPLTDREEDHLNGYHTYP